MCHDCLALDLSSFQILKMLNTNLRNLTLYYYIAWLRSIIHRGTKRRHRLSEKYDHRLTVA